mmetsp:Transcript_46914/g.75083  ORF Transcript_46914/g.75083 Transcript_46914/m.75083 type:complete len:221 (+) Transcript_46914:620-1282(+)
MAAIKLLSLHIFHIKRAAFPSQLIYHSEKGKVTRNAYLFIDDHLVTDSVSSSFCAAMICSHLLLESLFVCFVSVSRVVDCLVFSRCFCSLHSYLLVLLEPSLHFHCCYRCGADCDYYAHALYEERSALPPHDNQPSHHRHHSRVADFLLCCRHSFSFHYLLDFLETSLHFHCCTHFDSCSLYSLNADCYALPSAHHHILGHLHHTDYCTDTDWRAVADIA